jgi:hypothetical protein
MTCQIVLIRQNLRCFADDTNISASAESVEEKLNTDLSNIYQWLVANKLTLNVSKTEYMIIGSRNNLSKINVDPTIKIGGESVNRVKTTNSLGVVIDDKLKREDHIDSISKKVSKRNRSDKIDQALCSKGLPKSDL